MKVEGSKKDIIYLKIQWLHENGFRDGGVSANCFFCNYQSTCTQCPGRLVDPHFDCHAKEYYYGEKPGAFYKELLRLNRIRKGKNEKVA